MSCSEYRQNQQSEGGRLQDHSGSLRRSSAVLIAAAVIFVATVSYAIARYRMSAESSLKTVRLSGQWIRAAGIPAHAAYFRKTFHLPAHVRHAWIRIAASDAFEISVNRNPTGRQYLWRPTRPFQSGSSEKGQLLSTKSPAIALNFPREYQWDDHKNWLLPQYIDLTAELRQGRNTIAIEAESRASPACIHFTGQIELWSGEIIPLQSDSSWLGEPATPGPPLLDWTEPGYWDKSWRSAVLCDGPAAWAYRSVPEQVYTEAFNGRWMSHPTAPSNAAVTFRARWHLPDSADEAWLRLVCNRSYELLINGQRVHVESTRPPDLDIGSWVFGRATAHDPSAQPELLDPDEVGATFVGKRFESPRKADAQLEEFVYPFAPRITPFRYRRAFNRAQEPGVYQPRRSLAQSRRTPLTPDLFPERHYPNALKHDRSTGGYLSYSVAPLLVKGLNEIEIRCQAKSAASWAPQLAIDGGALTGSGLELAFVDNYRWLAIEASTGPPLLLPANVKGPANDPNKSLPRMQYRGKAVSSTSFGGHLQWATLLTSLGTFLILVCVLLGIKVLDWRMFSTADRIATSGQAISFATRWQAARRTMLAMLTTGSLTAVAASLVEISWAERHEILWCLTGEFWAGALLLILVLTIVVGLVDRLGDTRGSWLRRKLHGTAQYLRRLPETKCWYHLIFWLLVLGFVLRAYKLDLQPLDDDEYASVQAILSILECGTPGFVPEGIYYTRSPLFHYLTALLALPFGGNLWSLRLQSVAWGVATTWLAYLCGAQLLKSRWVGLISMLFLAVHPFEIFTGHVIRFYQMQQFFALLTIYCFCRGFVGLNDAAASERRHESTLSAPGPSAGQSQAWRIGTVFALLCAVLSQEISIALAPSLLFGYFVFAEDFGWRRNIELAIYSTAAVGLIGLDYLAFQTLCLTRTEGVSPSIEAAVKPHFWYAQNLLSLLIGYSRLHVVPSFFLLCGLPFLWREQNRSSMAWLAFLVSGVVMTNILVTNVSLRYMYWLFPVWILLCVDGLRLFVTWLVGNIYSARRQINRYVIGCALCSLVCVVSILASWSLWRITGSYELRILGDSTGAVRWVKSQKRPGDRLAITEPHTHCAHIEGEKCDYDIAIPLLYDFAVMKDGVLVDRNGGGKLISNLDQMIAVLAKGQRVWILLNREKFRSRGKNLRWEYPGARFELFIRKNCELKYRSYLWSVYLWDPAQGHYTTFQLQE